MLIYWVIQFENFIFVNVRESFFFKLFRLFSYLSCLFQESQQRPTAKDAAVHVPRSQVATVPEKRASKTQKSSKTKRDLDVESYGAIGDGASSVGRDLDVTDTDRDEVPTRTVLKVIQQV